MAVIYYASRTGTRRNLEAFRLAGWRILVSARGVLRTEGFAYAIDNGAWTSHTKQQPFDDAAFTVAVDKLGKGADWTAAPDIVCGGMESLAMSLRWLPWLLDRTPVALIPVQNGMEHHHLRGRLGARVGLFVGGDDTFKNSTMTGWARLARQHGAYCHVGRVNTRHRIRLCLDAGADSCDGTTGTKFAVNTPKVDAWRRQTSLIALVNP